MTVHGQRENEERTMTPKELAAYLQVPIKTLYQWRARSVGPKSYRVGRHLRYRRDEVDDWLESQAQEAGQ
jgi:excisionase family DNA binding protein